MAIPAFAFIGNYTDKGDGIQVKVTTQRHNPDPAFKPLFGIDMITLTLKGAENGSMVDFEGTALQLPGVTFKADADADGGLGTVRVTCSRRKSLRARAMNHTYKAPAVRRWLPSRRHGPDGTAC